MKAQAKVCNDLYHTSDSLPIREIGSTIKEIDEFLKLINKDYHSKSEKKNLDGAKTHASRIEFSRGNNTARGRY